MFSLPEKIIMPDGRLSTSAATDDDDDEPDAAAAGAGAAACKLQRHDDNDDGDDDDMNPAAMMSAPLCQFEDDTAASAAEEEAAGPAPSFARRIESPAPGTPPPTFDETITTAPAAASSATTTTLATTVAAVSPISCSSAGGESVGIGAKRKIRPLCAVAAVQNADCDVTAAGATSAVNPHQTAADYYTNIWQTTTSPHRPPPPPTCTQAKHRPLERSWPPRSIARQPEHNALSPTSSSTSTSAGFQFDIVDTDDPPNTFEASPSSSFDARQPVGGSGVDFVPGEFFAETAARRRQKASEENGADVLDGGAVGPIIGTTTTITATTTAAPKVTTTEDELVAGAAGAAASAAVCGGDSSASASPLTAALLHRSCDSAPLATPETDGSLLSDRPLAAQHQQQHQRGSSPGNATAGKLRPLLKKKIGPDNYICTIQTTRTFAQQPLGGSIYDFPFAGEEAGGFSTSPLQHQQNDAAAAAAAAEAIAASLPMSPTSPQQPPPQPCTLQGIFIPLKPHKPLSRQLSGGGGCGGAGAADLDRWYGGPTNGYAAAGHPYHHYPQQPTAQHHPHHQQPHHQSFAAVRRGSSPSSAAALARSPPSGSSTRSASPLDLQQLQQSALGGANANAAMPPYGNVEIVKDPNGGLCVRPAFRPQSRLLTRVGGVMQQR